MKRNLLTIVVGFLMASSVHSEIIEWTQEEARIYEENYEAMSFRCKIATSDAFQQLREVYYLPQDEEMFVYDLILEREFRKATYDYICKTAWDRVANKRRIDDLYQDSIDVRLLPHNNNVAGANVSIPLRLANLLKIDKQSYDKILSLGLKVCKHLRKDPRYNYDVEVMDSLRNFLSKEQLVIVLRSKNVDDAVNRAVATWNEVKSAGLIETEDSATCCYKASEYYLQERIVNEMFVGHDKVLRKNLSELWTRQPLIVRMSGAIKKKEALTKKKEEDNNDDIAW